MNLSVSPRLRYPNRLTVEELENRAVPAVYGVTLLSSPAGEPGETAATHAGELRPISPSLRSTAVVEAGTAADAVQLALTGTITATVGSQSASYPFGPDTAGDSKRDRLPYFVRVSGTEGRVWLEDLAGLPNSDWDYNDRSWRVSVRELDASLGGGSVVTLSYPQPVAFLEAFWYPAMAEGPDQMRLRETVTQVSDAEYRWDLEFTNTSTDSGSPTTFYHLGAAEFELSFLDLDAITRHGTPPAGWSAIEIDGPGTGELVRWETGYDFIMPGQSRTFTFYTAPQAIVWLPGIAGTPDDPSAGSADAVGAGLGPGGPFIDLDADTNRNGSVEDSADDPDEDKWTKALGTIYAVNHDDDDGNGKPDAVNFGDDGKPFDENKVLENAADAAQSAPLVIRKTGQLPAGSKLFLKVADRPQAESIHVFKARAAGETAILGDLGFRDGGDAAKTEVEITPFVSPTQDVTFGVEGMVYRFAGAAATEALAFDGYIDFTLELRDGTTGKMLKDDKVKMKVAPWVMLSNQEASKEVWATVAPGTDNEKFRLNAKADKGYNGLDNSGQLQTYTYDKKAGNNQWAQDHAEIGYTQRPGGSKIYATLRMPYGDSSKDPMDPTFSPQPPWVKEKLLGANSGVFQIGDGFTVNGKAPADSGDFGGNLELLPPTATHKLGRIVVGNSMSERLRTFLESQEVQPLADPLSVNWLDVRHVDEIVSFDRADKTVVVADPRHAYDLLEAIPEADRGKSVFFAPGNTDAGTVPNGSAQGNRINTGKDLRGKTAADWEYIRIYSDAGSGAKGQIGLISKWEDGYVEVSKVYKTTSDLVPQGAGATVTDSFHKWLNPEREAAESKETGWFTNPGQGDKFVLIQKSLTTNLGTPVAVTVAEVLADAKLRDLNRTLIHNEITSAKTKLLAAAGGDGSLTFVSVPVLFLGMADPMVFTDGQTAYHFTPGAVNLQIVGDSYYIPRQFGPRTADGKDIFEEDIRSRLANALFVDDWKVYHDYHGEVHCGSLVKREVWNKDWWAMQP